ncbi:MAG: T9SS type A sorting domain-containing protein [Chitinivibrionales bacterium]|nr:T9SS type A sorting domain-containing protein [Chitinivibrionales bacterium]
MGRTEGKRSLLCGRARGRARPEYYGQRLVHRGSVSKPGVQLLNRRDTMTRRFFIAVVLVCSQLVAQPSQPKEAYPYDIKQIHSGHSLTDGLHHPWPGQYRKLLTDHLGVPFDNYGASTIPGSSIGWRWNNATSYPDARQDIQDFELLSITDAVPLPSPQWFHVSCDNLSLFVSNAWQNGNGGEGAASLLWTTWTNIDDSDGPWRQLLDDYEPRWEEMADTATARLPEGAPPVYIIPGHRMMARLYDDIELGLVPGISDISEFFSDNIHLDTIGRYAAAMIHYACIFNESPVGLPNDLGEGVIPVDLAEYLQSTIWEIVTTYPWTGVRDRTKAEPARESDLVKGVSDFELKPAEGTLVITTDGKVAVNTVHVVNSLGRTVYSGGSQVIDISGFSPGTYFVKVNDLVRKLVK